jgi:hypothetical protein
VRVDELKDWFEIPRDKKKKKKKQKKKQKKKNKNKKNKRRKISETEETRKLRNFWGEITSRESERVERECHMHLRVVPTDYVKATINL